MPVDENQPDELDDEILVLFERPAFVATRFLEALGLAGWLRD